MRKLSVLILFISFSSMASDKGFPCDGAPGSWRTNPDSTPGGYVASTASVGVEVSTGVDTAVCEYAKVTGVVTLLDRARISGRATLNGKIQVSGIAEVNGEAQLINLGNSSSMLIEDNSLVGGNALLNGVVTLSDSSQVYGNAVIHDFVELTGTTKVCGQAYLSGNLVLNDDLTYCP